MENYAVFMENYAVFMENYAVFMGNYRNIVVFYGVFWGFMSIELLYITENSVKNKNAPSMEKKMFLPVKIRIWEFQK